MGCSQSAEADAAPRGLFKDGSPLKQLPEAQQQAAFAACYTPTQQPVAPSDDFDVDADEPCADPHVDLKGDEFTIIAPEQSARADAAPRTLDFEGCAKKKRAPNVDYTKIAHKCPQSKAALDALLYRLSAADGDGEGFTPHGAASTKCYALAADGLGKMYSESHDYRCKAKYYTPPCNCTARVYTTRDGKESSTVSGSSKSHRRPQP